MIGYILTKKTDEGLFKVNRVFVSKEYAENYKEKLKDSSLWKVEEVEYLEEVKPFKLEVGKCYKTRDGKKVFISLKKGKYFDFPMVGLIEGEEETTVWTLEGSFTGTGENCNDIIEEWKD